MRGWTNTRLSVLLAYLAVCAFVLCVAGDGLRHNDEAAYINGALQIAQGSISPWHAVFFNYDKQYASYWLVAGLFRVEGYRNLVAATNYAQAIAFCISLGVLVVCRLKRTPTLLILPFMLCPILVTSAPFVETGVISFVVLVLALSATRAGNARRQALTCLLIAIAAACRADIVLAVPALIIAAVSRRSPRRFLISPFAWAASACCIFPPLIGKLLDPEAVGVFQAGPSPLRVVAAFIVFALGICLFTLLISSSVCFVVVAVKKRRWRLYYFLRSFVPLIPLIFYLFQLQTPQQLLLTTASYAFLISDRRNRLVFARLRENTSSARVLRASIYLLTLVPWFVGLKAPSLAGIRPTLSSPQDFPTSHGQFPIGAYAVYMVHAGTHGYISDFNQAIFLAAEATTYDKCAGRVPILRTAMFEYLELAVRIKGLSPRIFPPSEEMGCPFVYADARSLIRDRAMEKADLLQNASLITSSGGQAILRLGTSRTNFGFLLTALSARFSRREFGLFSEPVNTQFELRRSTNGGALYAVSTRDCEVSPDVLLALSRSEADGFNLYLWDVPRDLPMRDVEIICQGEGQAGQLVWTFPSWIGR